MAIEYLTMQDVKAVELQLLHVFDSFCRENKLRYSLAYGTLLGAVRHKGFIPWDDDIDVFMPIEDYKKFCTAFPHRDEANVSNIGLASQLNLKGANAIPFEKVVDTNIKVKSAYIADDIEEYAWLDIFPIVSFESEAQAKKAVKTAEFYKHLFQTSRWSSDQRGMMGVTKSLIGGIARHTRLQQWALGKISAMLEGRSFSSRDIAASISWADCGYGELFPGHLFDELEEYEFEDGRFLGFKDFDCYLSLMYGDYMALPPVDKRVSHELKAWRAALPYGLAGMTGDGVVD